MIQGGDRMGGDEARRNEIVMADLKELTNKYEGNGKGNNKENR
jgi:hypothetical protein